MGVGGLSMVTGRFKKKCRISGSEGAIFQGTGGCLKCICIDWDVIHSCWWWRLLLIESYFAHPVISFMFFGGRLGD